MNCAMTRTALRADAKGGTLNLGGKSCGDGDCWSVDYDFGATSCGEVFPSLRSLCASACILATSFLAWFPLDFLGKTGQWMQPRDLYFQKAEAIAVSGIAQLDKPAWISSLILVAAFFGATDRLAPPPKLDG